MTKPNLIGMSREELSAFAVAHGAEPFRGKQLFRWLYAAAASDFSAMTNLSHELRERLSAAARISQLSVLRRQISARQDAEKFLFALDEGAQVESVLMHESDRHTLCLSSQVGCPVDCKFCATGKMGLIRNLNAGEILSQLLTVQSLSSHRIGNVVLMGMGEPMLNYEEVIKACYLMCDEEGPHLAQRHVVVSTSGLIPKIRRFTEEGHKFKLAISLNATTDEIRTQLMPLNRKYPIADLMNAAREYTLRSKQRVTFEYVLLAEVNDTQADADRLRLLVRGLPCKINLIPYNAIDETFRRPSYERIQVFYDRVKDLPVPVTLRWSKGDDIAAACGQLWTESMRPLRTGVAV